ncbi:MAG: hypothetical protein LiPW41_701 [Parcubacteria group bacterium LiPW_41]|nr:MAG: hypothetical protein LiPW41_701 [Parcubacteria group bacterium LiPW_41]
MAARNVRKVVDPSFLFQNFLYLINKGKEYKPSPTELENLKDLRYLLSKQLLIKIRGIRDLPSDIPIPIINFFPVMEEIINKDRRMLQFMCDGTALLLEYGCLSNNTLETLIVGLLKRAIDIIPSDATIQWDVSEPIYIKPLGHRIIIRLDIPDILVSDLWQYVKKNFPSAKDLNFITQNGFSAVVDENDVDRFYDVLEKFAKERDIAFGNHSNEKLTFGDLKTGDIFVSFPTPGDNSGHGGYLGEHYSFVKIEEDEAGNNAERAINSKMRSRFLPSFLVLKIA